MQRSARVTSTDQKCLRCGELLTCYCFAGPVLPVARPETPALIRAGPGNGKGKGKTRDAAVQTRDAAVQTAVQTRDAGVQTDLTVLGLGAGGWGRRTRGWGLKSSEQ